MFMVLFYTYFVRCETLKLTSSYSEILKRQGNLDYKEENDNWDCSEIMRFTESLYTWHILSQRIHI